MNIHTSCTSHPNHKKDVNGGIPILNQYDEPTLLQQGTVIDITYTQHQATLSFLLLPLLKMLSQQQRWIMWLSPQFRLTREWIDRYHLPAHKIIQLHPENNRDIIKMTERALKSGNYSCVLSWLPELSYEDKQRIYSASRQGQSYSFIINPDQHTDKMMRNTFAESAIIQTSFY